MTIWVVSKAVMGIDSDGYEFVKADEFDSAFPSKELAEKYVNQQESYGRKGYSIEEVLVDEDDISKDTEVKELREQLIKCRIELDECKAELEKARTNGKQMWLNALQNSSHRSKLHQMLMQAVQEKYKEEITVKNVEIAELRECLAEFVDYAEHHAPLEQGLNPIIDKARAALT